MISAFIDISTKCYIRLLIFRVVTEVEAVGFGPGFSSPA